MLVGIEGFCLSVRHPPRTPKGPSRQFTQAPILKERPASNASRISRAQEDSPPGSCNGFVLCGIPYRGRGCVKRHLNLPYEPASHFPYRAGQIGHREAPLLICNFSRVTQGYSPCKSRNRLISCALRDFLRISTGSGSRNPKPLWKDTRFCGKAPRSRTRSGESLSQIGLERTEITCACLRAPCSPLPANSTAWK